MKKSGSSAFCLWTHVLENVLKKLLLVTCSAMLIGDLHHHVNYFNIGESTFKICQQHFHPNCCETTAKLLQQFGIT